MVEGPDVSAEYLQADVGNHFTLEAQALAGYRPRRLVEGYVDPPIVQMDPEVSDPSVLAL